MSNLLTSGVTTALLSADSYAKLSSKPMNMASRELKKVNPDMDFVNRTMSYGAKELNKADKANEKAQEELEEAQKVAKAEKKAEDKAKIEQAIQGNKTENAQLQESASSTQTNKIQESEVLSSEQNATTQDKVEIDPKLLSRIENNAKIVVDTSKIYFNNKVAIKMSAETMKVDIST